LSFVYSKARINDEMDGFPCGLNCPNSSLTIQIEMQAATRKTLSGRAGDLPVDQPGFEYLRRQTP
jgi:hypothetical protein